MLPSTPAGEFAVSDAPCFPDEAESVCSTPFVSAPSSPGNGPTSGYFFSAPASPMHFLLSDEKSKSSIEDFDPVFLSSDSEFEFSSQISPNGTRGMAYMTSADELFLNGQIRTMKLSSHLRRPQEVVELCRDDSAVVAGTILRPHFAKFSRRKTRSMVPLRVAPPDDWLAVRTIEAGDQETGVKEIESSGTTPSCSTSSSRSSSSGRNSKKWMFLKDLLHRSKSEGRANAKERFWSAISFSSTKDKKPSPQSPALSPSSSRNDKRSPAAAGKPINGVWRRRIPLSAHGLHYAANRAQAEEMRKKTFLPYRQGLLGCLGFSSKSYGAFNGFTRSLNPLSSM